MPISPKKTPLFFFSLLPWGLSRILMQRCSLYSIEILGKMFLTILISSLIELGGYLIRKQNRSIVHSKAFLLCSFVSIHYPGTIVSRLMVYLHVCDVCVNLRQVKVSFKSFNSTLSIEFSLSCRLLIQLHTNTSIAETSTFISPKNIYLSNLSSVELAQLRLKREREIPCHTLYRAEQSRERESGGRPPVVQS